MVVTGNKGKIMLFTQDCIHYVIKTLYQKWYSGNIIYKPKTVLKRIYSYYTE